MSFQNVQTTDAVIPEKEKLQKTKKLLDGRLLKIINKIMKLKYGHPDLVCHIAACLDEF